jgi:glucose/arabinose dehydrogenase
MCAIRYAVLALLFLAAAPACTAEPSPQGPPSAASAGSEGRADEPELTIHEPVRVTDSAAHSVETICEGLRSPWGLAFLPDGRILVTERPGQLRIVEKGELRSDPVLGAPDVVYEGQGGLLDIELHPDFEANGLLYLAYTVPDGDGSLMTRISRFHFEGDALTDKTIVFPGFPGSHKAKHFGSRIRFLPDGTMLFTLGERGEGRRAQDLQDLNGKTLRLNDDGSVPDDNPFVGRDDARPEIYSYGNRNCQGMAIQPETGRVYQAEHGPSWNDAPGGGDEVNLILPGRNYGWPVVHHQETREGMVPPMLEYTPAIAPAGACFYTGDAIPEWTGDFFFTNLRGKRLIRIELEDGRPVAEEHLLVNRFGRLRDVATGPDGRLYVLTSDTDAYGPGRRGGDRLLRIVPTSEASPAE